jgi:hypothetical protein
VTAASLGMGHQIGTIAVGYVERFVAAAPYHAD